MGLKIAGGILILIGGAYVIHRTGVAKKVGTKISDGSAMMKDAFVEGYTEVVHAHP